MQQDKLDGTDLRTSREMSSKNHQLCRLLIYSLRSPLNDSLFFFCTDTTAVYPYEPVGCFKDKRNRRVLPVEVKTFSDMINESDLASSYAAIIHACATEVYKNDFWYFGVEYRHQCWSGVNGSMTYNRHGRSDYCLSNYSVGATWTIFVYRFVEGN